MGLYDQPYTDPMRDLIEKLEFHTERTVESTGVFHENPWLHEPGLSKTLSELEDCIEGTEIVPAVPEPLAIQPALEPHLSELPGPRSPGPPVPEESGAWQAIALMPPPAARPFFAGDGLAPSPYKPHFGGSTGIKVQGPATDARWCPRDECVKDIDECRECADWDEDSGECQHELA